MGRVLTNYISLAVAIEQTPGVLPGSPVWKVVEENSIGKFGPMLKKMAREPISKNRQRRKGALVDLDSSVEFECDLTMDHLKYFVEALFFATAKGAVITVPTAVTGTAYTVPALAVAPPAGTLVVARGFANAANNGLKVVVAASTTTAVNVAGLVAEATPPNNVQLEFAGVQSASGDFAISAAGNLTSTAFNWVTGSPIQVGQFIWIGDLAGSANSFAVAADRGFARVRAIAAGQLTLDKKSTVFTVDAGTGKLINVYWGQFIRDVAVDAADYLERTFQFELGYKNLQVPGPGDEYEYSVGNFINEITFDFPLTSKSSMKCGFVGLTTNVPTITRATNAATPVAPASTSAINTSADFMRLRVTNADETGVTTDVKSMSVLIKNNVTGEKVLGTLGAKYMNAGLFDVEVTADVLFTSDVVLAAMRDNRQVTMEVGVRNDDGGFILDIGAMTVEGGDKKFPVGQTVGIAMKSVAYQDPIMGTSAAISTFPFLPAS